MLQLIVGLVAACKAFNKLSVYIDMFIEKWVEYDIEKIGGEAEAKKQEFDALENSMKRTTNDTERLALLRITIQHGKQVSGRAEHPED